MKIISLKLLMICFMIGFGIFFALDIAHKGVSKSSTAEESQNAAASPIPTLKPAGVKPSEQASTTSLGSMTAATARQKAAEEQLKQAAEIKADQSVIIIEDSFVNRLTNKIGDVLRRLAVAMIDTIVTLFKLILG